MDRTAVAQRVHDLTGWPHTTRFQVFRETSDPLRMARGSIVELDGKSYVVKGHMREPRFGIDEQPKYWVINSTDLDTGETKILKTIFEEDFHVHIGILKIRCYRSASKESHVLELTRGDPRFMQGFTTYDEDGRNVRVLDYIRGSSLFKFIPTIEKDHATYFAEDLPGILWKLKDMVEAIELLHSHGLCHGDIRNDHIFKEDVSVIIRETKRCRDIVKNLLDFSRQDKPRFEEMSPNQIVERAIPLIEKLPQFRDIQLELKLTKKPPNVRCDPRQLQQVILNFMTNATEAMNGKGRITLTTSYHRRRNECVIAVEDTGPGIPENLVDKIFDPFFSTKGTNGLGLAVSWGIIERHGGTVEIDMAEHGGAIFNIVLPALQQQ